MAIAASVAVGACSGIGLGVALGLRSSKKQETAEIEAGPAVRYIVESAMPASIPAQPRMVRRGSSDLSACEEVQRWEGFTMEEARNHADMQQSITMERSPIDVLAELQKGNTRFWTNKSRGLERSTFERRALISKQYPSVAVLGCSDSRVPTELIFDHGLGDIFVVRTAGNSLAPATQASLQYAVHHLKVKVVMVLGHEMCGAVKAAMLPKKALKQEPAELQHVLWGIRMGLDADGLKQMQDARAHDREAVTKNVVKQVESLTRDEGIMAKVKQGDVKVVGAFYEISSGIVDFFHEVIVPERKQSREEVPAETEKKSGWKTTDITVPVPKPTMTLKPTWTGK